MRAEFVPFFEGVRERRLRFPRCQTCGQFHWYPLTLCPHCRSADVRWREVSGAGTVYSWTVVRHPFTLDLVDKLPCIVALVEFDDAPGLRLITNLDGVALAEISIGMAVEPAFEKLSDANGSLTFVAARQGAPRT